MENNKNENDEIEKKQKYLNQEIIIGGYDPNLFILHMKGVKSINF